MLLLDVSAILKIKSKRSKAMERKEHVRKASGNSKSLDKVTYICINI
tara:strand:+ start:101 stop:241 length:141 start_codon:yes stop_codon:yes gene_type:complete